MRGYHIEREVVSFPGGIGARRAEKEIDGAPALILRFPRREGADPRAYRAGADIAMQLRNDAALLPILEERFDEKEFACCVAYGFAPELTPLAEMLERYKEEEKNPLWAMRCAAEQLESLHKRRLSGHFLGAGAVFVDEENFSVRLAFIGMAEAFRAHGAAPRADGRMRPGYADDIYHLAKCFERFLPASSSDVARDCCAEDRSARPDYPRLLRAMAADAAFRPRYESEIPLMFAEKIGGDEAGRLIDDLNLNGCYISPWREREDGARECKFRARAHQGVFRNRKGEMHFYVLFYSEARRNAREENGKILRARFQYATRRVPGLVGECHHLAALCDEKDEAVQKWRLVPEQEKEYIEETAFKARYIHCRAAGEAAGKLAFLLRGDADWTKIESLRERHKRLDAVPMKIARRGAGAGAGMVYDITPGRLVLSVHSDMGEIPRAGELQAGGRWNVPFEFCWRRGREIYFAAPSDFDDEGEALKEIKAALQSGDAADVVIAGRPGAAGVLDDARRLCEIITRDAENKSPPDQGELSEDVSKETVAFKRQIAAVGQFERGDMAEPSLGGILATPGEHRPLIMPPAEAEARLFNLLLNDSQQKAVAGALFQKPLFLIQGPPGTGKTTVIVEIIRRMLAANPRARVLVCSQTHLAVDNVIERLPDRKEKGPAAVRKIRLAAAESRGSLSLHAKRYWLENRLKTWRGDVINRSGQDIKASVNLRKPRSEFAQKLSDALEKAGGEERKRERAIHKIVQKWHAFLRDDDDGRRQMRGNVAGGWLPLKTAFLKSMNVVGSTCVHVASGRYRELFGDAYDCLIMDEAGKSTPAESLIPIVRARHVVLVGDHKQLPPFVTGERNVWGKVQEKSKDLQDEGIENLRRRFGESLFEKLIQSPRMDAAQVMLDVQRRMPKQLGDLISGLFYGGQLRSPDDEEYAEETRAPLPFKRRTGVIFIKTDGRDGRHDNGAAHWRQNKCNAGVVAETLRILDDRLRRKADVAVIAAYRGQVDLLKRELRKRRFGKLELPGGDPSGVVNTVDGFQGRENDVVIYDVVRSSAGRAGVGFLDDPRRLNVALSRARKLLIVVGDADFLLNRARPGDGRESADKPILGEVAEEIARQGFMFNSLEEALR